MTSESSHLTGKLERAYTIYKRSKGKDKHIATCSEREFAKTICDHLDSEYPGEYMVIEELSAIVTSEQNGGSA